MKFKEFTLLSESIKDLYHAIGKRKTNKLLSTKQDPKITKLHDSVFGEGNHHIELPFNNDIPDSVKSHVESNGHKINDEQTHVLTGKGRPVEIAKYLNDPRNKASRDNIKTYHDFQKGQGSHKIVVTRKPPEVTACSTGTPFNSCANAEKIDGDPDLAAAKLPKDIHHGTLMTMVVRKDAKPNEDGEYDGKDIHSRVLLKRHTSKEGHDVFVPENKTYAAPGSMMPTGAVAAVKKFAEEKYPMKDDFYTKNTELYNDADDKIKTNSNMPADRIHKILDNKKTKPDEIHSILATAKNVNSSHIDKILNHPLAQGSLGEAIKLRSAAVKHDAATDKHITDAMNEKYDDGKVAKAALQNKNINEDHLTLAMNHKDDDVRYAALSHPKINESHIKLGLRDAGYDARNRAANHEKFTKEHLDALLNSDDEKDRATAFHNKTMIKSTNIDKAMNDSSDLVRTSAVQHIKATPEHIAKGVVDPSPYVRMAAATHKWATNEQLEKLKTDENDDVSFIANHQLMLNRFKN